MSAKFEAVMAKRNWARAGGALRRQWIGILALFIALGGTGYAAATLPRNSVTAKQIKRNAVAGSEIRKGAVTGVDVKNRSLSVADFVGGLPAGEPGAQGPTGETGPAGTARAYAYVAPNTCAGGPPAQCTLDRSKGVASVTRTSTGAYCVTAPGLDSSTTPAIVAGDYQATGSPEALTSVQWHGGIPCAGGGYQVITKRINTITVRDSAGTGTTTVADNTDSQANDVSFVIAIP